ncbi:hypothetical protein TNCV_2931241 [Trichonephila clavipes]|nr:hypothetical protein TNCV_2931241 [Trichonephila clavipes]
MLWRPMKRFQEQSSAILTAKVAIPVYSPTKEDEKIDELKFVRIKCGNEIHEGFSVVNTDTVPRYPCNRIEDFQYLKIDDSNTGSTHYVAVSKRLVNDMLDCSSAYEASVRKRSVYSQTANSYVSSRAVEGITADDPEINFQQRNDLSETSYPLKFT